MIGLGLGVALGSALSAAAPAGPNPNLLLWSEEFQRAQWGPINATVTVDQVNDPDGLLTADQITNTGPTGLISQTSGTAATLGTPTSEDINVGTSWERFFVVCPFDGSDHCFSVYLQAASSTALRLSIDITGGFIRCIIRDVGDEATYYAWGAKLEQASSPTAYIKREGT